MPNRIILILFATLLPCGGCAVQRTITIRSNPEGALVWLNDQELGRTPITRDFKWYGTYDVEVRKEGYQTLRTTAYVGAPWWQWVPFDLIAEFTPGKHVDHHDLGFTMKPVSDEPADPVALVGRGEQLRLRLESGERTKGPTTAPATSKHKHPPATSAPAATSETQPAEAATTGVVEPTPQPSLKP